MGNKLLLFLMVEYLIIAIVYLFQKQYAKSVYFLGAIILSCGILWME